ncbi:hypothetical protein [Rhodococcus sp. NPDC003348]
MPTSEHPDPQDGRPSGFGDAFPKLLLVNPKVASEPRLLRALHLAGIAARPTHRPGEDPRLFGARVVDDPGPGWDELRPWVRAVVAFGADAWTSTLGVLSLDGPEFGHGVSVSGDGDKPVTVLGCLALDDPALTDATLAESLATAQGLAGLAWGCGGKI